MSASRISMLVILLVACFVGYRFYVDSQVAPEPPSPPVRNVETNDSVQVTEQIASTVPDEIESIEEVAAGDQPGCLTLSRYEEHPLIVAEYSRLIGVSPGGPDIVAYRDVDIESVNGFALQGDSAAMAVMGAASVLKALGKNETDAISMLQMEGEYSSLTLAAEQFSPEAMLSLNDAAYWYYESALHGRVYSLRHYGEVRGIVFGGPVGLGWVSREDYDTLDSTEKLALDPFYVYHALANDIAPQLKQGALGVIATSLPQSVFQQEIRANLQREFSEAVAEADLPPINVSDSVLEDEQALYDQICESTRRELERREALQ